MESERTSAEIAAHAARILGMDDAQLLTLAMQNPELIRRVAASALTQAADKPKPGKVEMSASDIEDAEAGHRRAIDTLAAKPDEP